MFVLWKGGSPARPEASLRLLRSRPDRVGDSFVRPNSRLGSHGGSRIRPAANSGFGCLPSGPDQVSESYVRPTSGRGYRLWPEKCESEGMHDAFSGNPLERASEFRVRPRLDRGAAGRGADSAPVAAEGAGRRAGRRRSAPGWHPAQCEALAAADAPCVFLGLEDGQPLFALDISAGRGPAPGRWPGWASFATCGAAAFVLPDARHRHPGPGQGADRLASAPWLLPQLRRAPPHLPMAAIAASVPHCGAEHFPRTDPVVIMLPVLGDALPGRPQQALSGRALFRLCRLCRTGRNHRGSGAARIARGSESGGRRGDLSRLAALAVSVGADDRLLCRRRCRRDFSIDGQEIADARWMSRDEVRARLAGEIDDEHQAARAHRHRPSSDPRLGGTRLMFLWRLSALTAPPTHAAIRCRLPPGDAHPRSFPS